MYFHYHGLILITKHDDVDAEDGIDKTKLEEFKTRLSQLGLVFDQHNSVFDSMIRSRDGDFNEIANIWFGQSTIYDPSTSQQLMSIDASFVTRFYSFVNRVCYWTDYGKNDELVASKTVSGMAETSDLLAFV